MNDQMIQYELNEVELNLNDYKAFFLRRGGRMRKTIIASRIFGFIFLFNLVLPFVMQLSGYIDGRIYNFNVGMILFLFIFIILPIIGVPYLINNEVKKLYNNNKSGRSHYTFTETFIEVKFRNGVLKFHWEEIYLIEETNKYFFVYLKKESALTIPKTYINEENEVTTLLRSKMK